MASMSASSPRSDPGIWKTLRGNQVNISGARRSASEKTISRGEVKALLDATKPWKTTHDLTAYDLFVIGANLGLRSIEIIRMRFEDFSYLRHRYVIVRTAKKRLRTEDKVYLGSDEADLLKEVRDRRRSAVRGDHLFPISTRAVRHYWAYYSRKAGIHPRITFHSLRHFAGSEMAHYGGGDRYAMTRLRHEPPKILATLGYIHVSADQMMEAADKKGAVR